MKITVATIRERKAAGDRITMVTAYDHPSALAVDAAGIDMILVGDSLGNVVLGHETTVPVTMDDMLHHVRAVTRGARRALVVADMPFLSYRTSIDDAVRNAGRLLQEGGATAVKLEGGSSVVPVIERLVDAGIPVLGHLGLMPQSVNVIGGYRMQAGTVDSAEQLVDDALRLEAAGAFGVVLELVPAVLAGYVTRRLRVPTIGIGAGAGCDGQVQVWHDLLGLGTGHVGRHARRYVDLESLVRRALEEYREDVRAGAFPTDEHSFAGPAPVRALVEQWEAGERARA